MDTISSVARRTRSNTLLILLEQLSKSKKENDQVEDAHEDSTRIETETKIGYRSNFSSPAPAKRRRRQKSEGDNYEKVCFRQERERQHAEDDNAGSTSVSSPRLKSESVEPRVSDFAVSDENFCDDVDSHPNEVIEIEESCEEKTSSLAGSALGSSSFSKVISLDSDGESSVEKLGTDGEDSDNDDCSDKDEDDDVESESSDSLYQESSEESEDSSSEDSAYTCSEDETVEGGAGISTKRSRGKEEDETEEVVAGNNTKSRKRSRIKERREKLKDLRRTDRLNLFHQLASSILDKDNNSAEEDESSCDELDMSQCGEEEPPLLNPKFGYDEPEPVEKSEEEKELDALWKEMAFALESTGIESADPVKNENVSGTQATPSVHCSCGKHEFVIDEEVGLKCYYCSYVAVEIRNVSPAMEKYRRGGGGVDYKRYTDRKDGSLFNSLELDDQGDSISMASLKNTKGTVWDFIPGIRDTLYPHQQEGFEFIWKNLIGTTSQEDLNNWGVSEKNKCIISHSPGSRKTPLGAVAGCGGCIISHSPGTGKTRLTIVFLQAFLKRFPDSHPVIVAPASMLLTWEEEFKKWNVKVPFHNVNSLDFSGKESKWAHTFLEKIGYHRHDKNYIRKVKLFSWCRRKSILGVSYHLFVKLTGKKCNKKPGKRTGLELDSEMEERIQKYLLEWPELLILDEGHTPRNRKSLIWKALEGVQTKNRIILSGTPFQNNFQELSNVLCLTRPAYAEAISSKLKELGKWSMERGQKGKEYEQAGGIKGLRALLSPFVHVHKGSILRESLPGLRESVVVLKPQDLQKKILDRIDRCQNTFELEHKLSSVSVHPSLFLGLKGTKKEEIIIGKSIKQKLERNKLNLTEGAKARFLVDFVRLSTSIDEKVLVFSQYLDILSLIMELLTTLFGWTEEREVSSMHGKLELKERQRLINNFNDPDSEAKVLLASTKACSEGINLVGASRVILLDVVWNPSVERKAISRAYRLGQKRTVYTYHLVMKDTPECDKYCKQAEKHRISELVFTSKDERDKLENSRVVKEDKILEEMILHGKLREMFDKIIYHPHESDLVEGFRSTAL
ncbi:PREDICTED: SNF2 domain-containing protein CLASSY 4 [Tarenaya hassleriana]|uniref:SNF2 domain-containing protein CLASSY 4 n=1 Tax=Tarenaya hassleriana TaxID=28532 RepID=UPI00053C797C|nr:PREDICTED: SNF2 domain-containing protein CLASSY 4 [Tarenaya hassleriana]